MEYAVLGPVEARQDGRPVELGGARQRALLALLLFDANRVVPTERLVDELWPREAPQTARTGVRVAVSQLRKALGADAIATSPPGYRLVVDPMRVDLHRFERLAEDARRSLEAADPAGARVLAEQALALWRGPALADVAALDFARAEAARLEELRHAVVERRIEADLALGRHVDVVAELEGLLARSPLRERLAELLMLALYRSGRQAHALDVYQRTRSALVGELGIEPGEPLRRLEGEILRQEPALDRAAATPTAERPGAILLVLGGRADEPLLELARTLVREPPRELILCRLVSSPDALPVASREVHALREELLAAEVRARAAVFTSPDPGADIVRLAERQDVELALAAVTDDEIARLPGGDLGWVLASAPCDVALLAGARRGRKPDGPLLVPFAGADHDWSAIELGAWIARTSGKRLILAGAAADRRRRRDASRLLANASLVVQQISGVAAEPSLVGGGTAGMVEAGRDAALVVAGLSERWPREGVGEARIELVRGGAPVLLVRRGLRPGVLAPPEGLTRFTWTLATRG